MVAVERISHFIDLPAEAPLHLEHSRPSHDWPSKGTIVIENLKVGPLKRLMEGSKDSAGLNHVFYSVFYLQWVPLLRMLSS